MTGDRVAVVVDLSPNLAWSLAQFVKRVGWSEIRSNAVDGEEAEQGRLSSTCATPWPWPGFLPGECLMVGWLACLLAIALAS